MRASLFLLSFIVVAGCGGRVVVDAESDPGAGGAPTLPLASSATTSTAEATAASSNAATTSTGSGAECPAFPLIQAPCAVQGQSCPVPFGCCGGNAVCGAMGVWEYDSAPCESCVPCGASLSCTPGTICVRNDVGFSVSFSCRKDPCPGSSDCACAQPLCEGTSLSCLKHTSDVVICTCTTC